MGKDSAIAVSVAGVGGVPATGVAAVAVNVTVTQPVATGYLTVYASGTGRPTASNLNFVKGLTVANLVIAPVGADGKIAIYNGSPGTVQIVADVAGYYHAGNPAVAGAFGSIAPLRVLDTRIGTGAPKAAVGKDASIAVSVVGQGGVPATGVAAVAVNVTVTAPTATGYLSVYADGTSRPTASNLNFVKAQTVPNMVMAPVGADGKIRIYNGSPGTVQIVADISGYMLAGLPSAAGTFTAIAPYRVLDTRNGTGATKKAVPKDSSIAVSVAGLDNLPPTGIAAVAVNITATQPTTTGYLTVYADGTTRPTASNLNFVKRATVPNLVMAPVGTDGKIRIYNGSPGTVQIVADISGYTLAADTPQWTTVDAPLPSNAAQTPNATLASPVCADVCYVTGTYTGTNGNTDAVLETWSQGQWTASKIPVPQDGTRQPSLYISELACDGDGTCVLVGSFTNSSGTPQLFIDTLTTGGWQASLPEPPAGGTGLDASLSSYPLEPSCGGAATCVASFWYRDADGHGRYALDTLSGSGWTMTEAPLPSGADSSVELGAADHVACGANGTCLFAVGYTDTDGIEQVALDTLTNGDWNSVKAPLTTPMEAGGGVVTSDATCGGVCLATIYYSPDGSAGVDTDMDVFSGGGWTATAWPNVTSAADPGPFFCDDGDTCFGVEDAGTSELVDQLTGGSWTLMTLTNPAGVGAGDWDLEQGGCGGPGACVAVGFADWQLILATPGDDTWKVTAITPPAAGDETAGWFGPWGPTCRSDGRCVVPAVYDNTGAETYTAQAYVLVDGVWTSANLPLPSDFGSFDQSLDNGEVAGGSACSSSGCVLSGNYYNEDGDLIPILSSSNS